MLSYLIETVERTLESESDLISADMMAEEILAATLSVDDVIYDSTVNIRLDEMSRA